MLEIPLLEVAWGMLEVPLLDIVLILVGNERDERDSCMRGCLHYSYALFL